jgi:ADP-dependent NAD(P)H-hydrate dehydratase / NAD(P)H-hydrate epimerase
VVNPSGNPGMAKGGSGDVLTGIVGALLARGVEATSALWAGCYVHGAAGDVAARARGEYAVIASDIIESLPAALRALSEGPA